MAGINNLRKIIRECQERLEELPPKNESQTRYTVIDPILRALGYDTEDLRIVRTEVFSPYKVPREGKRRIADYTLWGREGVRGIIEAKRFLQRVDIDDEWDDDEWDDDDWEYYEEDAEPVFALEYRHRRQLYMMTRYGFKLSSGRAVLTNGNEWEIYEAGKWKKGFRLNENSLERSILARVSLLDDGVADCARTLLKFLSIS